MGATPSDAGYGARSLQPEGEGGDGYHRARQGEDEGVPPWWMEGRRRLVEIARGGRHEEQKQGRVVGEAQRSDDGLGKRESIAYNVGLATADCTRILGYAGI